MANSKELQAINDALKAFYEKHNGNVVINASVLAFDDNNQVIDGNEHLWDSGNLATQLTNLNVMMTDCIDKLIEPAKKQYSI